MKLNVGGLDRGLRIVASLALIGLTLTGTVGAWGGSASFRSAPDWWLSAPCIRCSDSTPVR
jgi:Protein of unknown function (DUF2892)